MVATKQNGGRVESTPRAVAWLAWSLCALSLALTLLSIWLLLLNLSRPEVPVYTFWIENVLFSVGFSLVGAVIVPRIHSGNRTGWLFCAIGLAWAVIHFSAQYAIYALVTAPGSLPAGRVAVWYFSWPPFVALGLMALLGLVFPDGRLPSGGWRWFARLCVLSTVVAAILAAISPGPIPAGPLDIRNPLAVDGLPNLYRPVQALMFALVSGAAISLLVRRYHARGVERQQIKWFTYALAVGAIGVTLKYVISDPLDLAWLGAVGYALDLIGTAGMPIAMGIAVARYRLYDIDLIVNLTLVYGALTATLAGVYFASVTATQAIFQSLTGFERLPQLAIVASTLAIAALFNPLRRRIQILVDRRFYRRKFDAARVLESFAARLRDETDLDALGSALVGVVERTMQPAHTSLWLRTVEPSRKED